MMEELGPRVTFLAHLWICKQAETTRETLPVGPLKDTASLAPVLGCDECSDPSLWAFFLQLSTLYLLIGGDC